MLQKNVKSLLEQLKVCIFAEIVFGVRCTFSVWDIFDITREKVRDLRVRMVTDTKHHGSCKVKGSNLETLQLEKYKDLEKFLRGANCLPPELTAYYA